MIGNSTHFIDFFCFEVYNVDEMVGVSVISGGTDFLSSFEFGHEVFEFEAC